MSVDSGTRSDDSNHSCPLLLSLSSLLLPRWAVATVKRGCSEREKQDPRRIGTGDSNLPLASRLLHRFSSAHTTLQATTETRSAATATTKHRSSDASIQSQTAAHTLLAQQPRLAVRFQTTPFDCIPCSTATAIRLSAFNLHTGVDGPFLRVRRGIERRRSRRHSSRARLQQQRPQQPTRQQQQLDSAAA